MIAVVLPIGLYLPGDCRRMAKERCLRCTTERAGWSRNNVAPFLPIMFLFLLFGLGREMNMTPIDQGARSSLSRSMNESCVASARSELTRTGGNPDSAEMKAKAASYCDCVTSRCNGSTRRTNLSGSPAIRAASTRRRGYAASSIVAQRLHRGKPRQAPASSAVSGRPSGADRVVAVPPDRRLAHRVEDAPAHRRGMRHLDGRAGMALVAEIHEAPARRCRLPGRRRSRWRARADRARRSSPASSTSAAARPWDVRPGNRGPSTESERCWISSICTHPSWRAQWTGGCRRSACRHS